MSSKDAIIIFVSSFESAYLKYLTANMASPQKGLYRMRNISEASMTWQWRHNGHASVWNHQPHDCLLNHLFRRTPKKTSKLRVTGLCAGNSPGTGEFPAQMASYAENVSIWWRHHGIYIFHVHHCDVNISHNPGPCVSLRYMNSASQFNDFLESVELRKPRPDRTNNRFEQTIIFIDEYYFSQCV